MLNFKFYNLQIISKNSSIFADCGPSPTIPNAEKTINLEYQVNSETIEQRVTYTCKNSYFLVPESVNTTYNCVNGGEWEKNEFECLKSRSICLFSYKTLFFH